MSRRDRPSIDFTDKDGRPAGRALVTVTGGVGNKHLQGGRRKVLCTEPGCGELFAPVCPNLQCAGSRVPRAMMRLERIDRRSLVTDEAKANADRLRRVALSLPEPRPKREQKSEPVKVEPHRGLERRPRVKVASEAHVQKLQATFEKRRAA